MLWRLMSFVSVMAGAVPAYALNACFVESAGQWTGPIYEGAMETLDTNFVINRDGTLSGTYQVHDDSPYRGTLTDFRQTGICTAQFTWHDRYGTGFVSIDFAPEQGQFRGMWGAPKPLPRYIFDGFRRPSEPLT